MRLTDIQHIFFDLDNTLWDFSGNSKRIVQAMYDHFDLYGKGITSFESFNAQYRFRNEHLWHAYGKGTVSREEVRLHRFLYTLHDFNVSDYVLADKMADYYVQHTRNQTDLLPDALEILNYLRQKYQLHIITNGFNEVQYFKLKNSGIDSYFTTVTTAEEAQALKPSKKIFEIALGKIPAEARHSIYIGDSPEADGTGAKNAGMRFILFARELESGTQFSGLQIHSLLELKNYL